MNFELPKTSINFKFLKQQWPDLAELVSLAENYVYTDPASCMVKLRTFAELIVDILYHEMRLSKPPGFCNFYDLLNDYSFKNAVPDPIINVLNLIRKEGNKGAHEVNNQLNTSNALDLLKQVHRISIWFYKTINKSKEDIPVFRAPPRPADYLKYLKTQKVSFEKEKAEWEKEKEEYDKRIQELQEQQKKLREAEEKTEPKITITPIEMSQFGTEEANRIGLSEAETRKLLIESQLKDAGWKILKNKSEYDTNSIEPQVIPEYKVENINTPSGRGYCDYVLMGKNGKPIALIEAKKASRSADDGKNQAEMYAEGIEKETNQRPFIYFTNGHDIHFWDDINYPDRQVWGYYDLDKLEILLFRRDNRKLLSETKINTKIAGRPYQLEGIRRVYETFEDEKRRKALIVMATGTGKTRVAMAIIEGLMRARWIKRVLFLVDRIELRKQAVDNFKEHLPEESRIILSGETKGDKDKRIYIATYPAIQNSYHLFNVGFFDLIIADESHRSIYKFYREIFQYFDALQIGLTATPVTLINRNTFSFFELPHGDPTFHYSLEEAINNKPPYLVGYKVDNKSTVFLERGIKYNELTEEQRLQLEEQDETAQTYNFEKKDVDKLIMNKETNRKIIRHLMETGIKDSTGTKPGKTIIFARSHDHAILMEKMFNEMYPQYRGKMAQVIDTYNEKASTLIDGFKGKNDIYKELQIAISVDMLDTGIDVPEVVNLVFAKPVYSRVKFWQMIGRGTRLCPDLFGQGKDKKFFLIFDPWFNFGFFEENPEGYNPSESRSLPERLFKVRLDLLNHIKNTGEQSSNYNVEGLDKTITNLLRESIDKLPDSSVSVKEKWQEMEQVKSDVFWHNLREASINILDDVICPLMRWSDVQGDVDALQFDNKIAKLELSLLEIEYYNRIGDQSKKASKEQYFDRLKEEVVSDIFRIKTNLNQVKPEIDFINQVKQNDWWDDANPDKLEELRNRLRDLMKYRQVIVSFSRRVIDIDDYDVAATESPDNMPDDNQMEAYRERLTYLLNELVNSSLTLQKIRRAKPISDQELQSLSALILERDPGLNLEDLKKVFPDKAGSLDKMIRSIVGLELLTVHEMFDDFRNNHTTLTGNQMQFLNLLEQEISKAGGLPLERLYEQPFTNIDSGGISGLFDDKEVDEIIDIINSIAG